jgi:hypothetical protein
MLWQKNAKNPLLTQVERLELSLRSIGDEYAQGLHEAKERVAKARAEYDQMQLDFSIEQDKKVKERAAVLALQQIQIRDAHAAIAELRQEYRLAQREQAKLRRSIDQIFDIQEEISNNSFSLAESVDLVGEQAADEQDLQGELLQELHGEKDLHAEAHRDVLNWQEEYMREAEDRLEQQKVVAQILNKIQSAVEDESLINDTLDFAMRAEERAREIMMELQAMDASLPTVATTIDSSSNNSWMSGGSGGDGDIE